MDFGKILGGLQSQLGDKVDLSSIKGTQDLGKLSEMLNGAEMPSAAKDLLAKLQTGGAGDLDGDGVQESLADELKGKAEQLLGGSGILGGLFGKK